MSNIVNVQYEMDRFSGKRADLKVIKTNKEFKFNFDLNKKIIKLFMGFSRRAIFMRLMSLILWSAL